MNGTTVRERLLAIYRNDPSATHAAGTYTRYLPRGSAERENRARGLGLVDFYPAVSLLAPPWHTREGYLSDVRGASFQIEHSCVDGARQETRRYETPVGSVSQTLRRDAEHDSDWTLRHYITDPDDYRVMRHIVENTEFRVQHDTVRERIRDLGEDGVLLARLDRSPFQKVLIELADPQRFLMDVMARLPEALALLEAIRLRLDEQAEMACATPAELIWQPDNVSGDMTSPAFFEEFCLPFYQANAERFRRAGKVYVVHMDGRLGALRDLIAASGIHVVESFSVPDMGNDMTLADARDAWPGKVVIPNFPASWCANTDDWILGKLGEMRASGDGRPVMIQVSEDIPSGQWGRVGMLLTEGLA